MQSERRGFILYIVVTVLLALAILAFALNRLKSGTVTQLARNVDQNRLSLLAQSANAEVIAIIRSNANYELDSQIFKRLRSVFPDDSGSAPPIGTEISLISNFVPPQTLEIANNAGYNLVIKSRATLTTYRVAPAKSVLAYNAYLDVYSQAYRQGAEEHLLEVHERRDVRLVDMRHRLDRYALFVKNYAPNYNHSRRRIIIEGIGQDGPHISHAYLGHHNYPSSAEPAKQIFFDLFFEESSKLPNFSRITGFDNLKTFPNATMPACLFNAYSYPFASLQGISPDQFFRVKAVIKLYELFVNQAADGCLGNTTPSSETRLELRKLCERGMKATNSNAAAYDICEDFYRNFKMVDNQPKYSDCAGFQKILNTCILKWPYTYGYTDANSIWAIENTDYPNLPATRDWATALAFGGIASPTEDLRNKGSYFAEYLEKKAGKDYNPERVRVGKMPLIYGADCKNRLFVEGPVFLRFFKVGFLDTFSQNIEFFRGTRTIEPEPVPLRFLRYDKYDGSSFLNTKLNAPVPNNGLHKENFLMSRAIDNISVNALMGDSISIYDGGGNVVSTSTILLDHANCVEPLQPAGSNLKATNFGRLIDFKTVGWNYPNTTRFLEHRKGEVDGKKTLFIDGFMYIEEGDLDLTGYGQFYGKGMIFLGRGNCLIGNLKRIDGRKDTLRIYLRAGKYILPAGLDQVEIQASLAAFYYPFGSGDPEKMGGMILSGQSQVKIKGNLLVDYLYTEDRSGAGLADGGSFIVEHDPLIYDPALEIDGQKQDPYHVSIGPVKTIYSVNTGGKTF